MEDASYDDNTGYFPDDDGGGPPPPGDEWALEEAFFSHLTVHTLICSISICIVGLVGLVGNGLMLRAWIKYPNLRNDFYTCFFALSLVDVLFTVISVPATIAEMMQVKEINTNFFCKASKYLMYASGFASAYTVVVLSALRAILLTNRNRIPRPRAKHMMYVSVISYVLIYLLSIPIIEMHTNHGAFCYLDASIGDGRRHVWLLDSFSAFVPLFLVFVFYVISFVLGKRYFADSYSPRERQKSRLVSCMVVAFVICQLPYRFISIYELYVTNDGEMLDVISAKDYLMVLLVVGKVLRPILYSKLTKDLGHAFDEIINCQKCHKNHHHHHNNSSGSQNGRINGSLIQTPALHPELLPGSSETPIPPPLALGATAADFENPEEEEDDDPEPPSPLPTTSSRSPRKGVDRTISTSSTVSTNSQAPLIRHSSSSSPSEIEMM